MMRLLKHGLMYGNLFQVSSPSLVARYNRALEHLTGRQTGLEEFHIDISGFSPEIGDELGDPLYLNPNGCNRQFILLSASQKTAPLLNAQFSTSRSILRQFIDENEDQIFALTIRDAVVGELLNTVFAIEAPTDLFHIRSIRIEADTVGAHVDASGELSDKIRRFMEEPDGWWDDVLVADMIELARHTGDIIRTPLKLTTRTFEQSNFHTAHCGGLYIFEGVKEPACLASDMPDIDPASLPVRQVLTLDDRPAVAEFLLKNRLIEPVLNEPDARSIAILRQKLDFIAIDVAAGKGEDLSEVSRQALRSLKRKYHRDFPAEYRTLENIVRRTEAGAPVSLPDTDDPAFFYLVRSANHRDKHLVNMLLAELTPLDFRQLFICHKDAFYAHYRSWSDFKKEYAVRFLAEEYMLDKVGTREELFGPEPGMFAEDVEDSDFGFGRNMGPWGAIPAADDEGDAR